MSLFRDFIELFFPRNCCICGKPLVGDEKEICLDCLFNLPEALGAKGDDNLVARRLRGRVPLEAAYALLLFKRKNSTQTLLHQIKYKGNEQLANIMGHQMGRDLAQNPAFNDIDIIIPVPLHPRKIRIRGYNQSLLLCKGIVDEFSRPISDNNLIRIQFTETQTQKNREERIDNMKGVFALRNPDALKGKHILLVDDVITTGATTEACWRTLKTVEGLKISLAALAITNET